jgi:hypothetical protein
VEIAMCRHHVCATIALFLDLDAPILMEATVRGLVGAALAAG